MTELSVLIVGNKHQQSGSTLSAVHYRRHVSVVEGANHWPCIGPNFYHIVVISLNQASTDCCLHRDNAGGLTIKMIDELTL